MASKILAVAELKRLGAKKVVGQFSGGNDEGGYDGELVLTDATGEEIKSIPAWGTGSEPIRDFMNDILYGQYGSFAGEFSVYGTVTLDVDGTCKMSGQENVEHYEPFDHSF